MRKFEYEETGPESVASPIRSDETGENAWSKRVSDARDPRPDLGRVVQSQVRHRKWVWSSSRSC